MKKTFLIPAIFLSIFTLKIHAQCGGISLKTMKATSMGIVIYSNDAETVWNAFRFANYSVSSGDTVDIFLLGKGVDLDSLDNKNFNVKEQTDIFIKNGGKILACSTCLKSRNISSPKACSFSTMTELYEMVKKSKIVLTF